MTFFNLTGCFDPPQTERSDFSDKLSLAAYFFQLHWLTFPLFTPSLSESTFYSLLWFTAAVQHAHGEHQSRLSLSLITTEQQSPESLSASVLLRDKQFPFGESASTGCWFDSQHFVLGWNSLPFPFQKIQFQSFHGREVFQKAFRAGVLNHL